MCTKNNFSIKAKLKASSNHFIFSGSNLALKPKLCAVSKLYTEKQSGLFAYKILPRLSIKKCPQVMVSPKFYAVKKLYIPLSGTHS